MKLDAPPLTWDEIEFICKQVNGKLSHQCGNRRSHCKGKQRCIAAYKLNNQCDFYKPNCAALGKGEEILMEDEFLKAFTPFNEVSRSFETAAKDITVRTERNVSFNAICKNKCKLFKF